MKRIPEKRRKLVDNAVSNYMKQLHMREAFLSVEPYQVIEEENTAALEHLLFLKDKRNLSIKAQGCAYVQKQQEGPNKIDAISPTVSLEVILITSCIDAA